VGGVASGMAASSRADPCSDSEFCPVVLLRFLLSILTFVLRVVAAPLV